VIAERLTESKTTIPHYYLSVELKMDKLMNFRKKINDSAQTKISVNDIIVKATALAIKNLPEINAQWGGQFVRNFKNIDISIAVSTDSGLITPIVFDADKKSIVEISKNIKELAEKAKSNKLKPQEFQVK
jgi:pyruvate dehydrogenase E2 component (dihydrolipoamide acetyltransferase)